MRPIRAESAQDGKTGSLVLAGLLQTELKSFGVVFGLGDATPERSIAGARGTLGLLEAKRAAQGFDPEGEQVNHQPAEQPGRRPGVGKGTVAALIRKPEIPRKVAQTIISRSGNNLRAKPYVQNDHSGKATPNGAASR